MAYQMNPQELSTVLAALRFFQDWTPEEGRKEYSPDHFLDIEPLNDAEIDALCENLNDGNYTEEQTVEKAREMFEDDEGTLEIDAGAPVSRAEGNEDKGAYVQAWVWVPDEETEDE